MRKWLKKSGLILSVALGISLIGQFAYAQTPIYYDCRLPEQGYTTTSNVTKTNKNSYADNTITYFGWKGSGVDWWLCDMDGNRITVTGNFTDVGASRIHYMNGGDQYYYHTTYAKIKTDGNTWNECDVAGKIWP